jgi:hypothetical protein
MNAADFAALWFGRVWGCFWIGVVFFIAWLAVRDRVVTRRARRAAHAQALRASMQAHPAGDDWRVEAGYPLLSDAEIAAFWKANTK